MAEEIDQTVEQLRELLSQQPDQEPLPRLGGLRKFGLGFAGALDPRFQQQVAGPLLRRDEQVPFLEIEREEAARQQQIQELGLLLKTLGAQSAEERAVQTAEIQGADAAIRQEHAERQDLLFQQGQEDRAQEDINLANEVQFRKDNFAAEEERLFAASASVLEATDGTIREDVGKFYAQTLDGLHGILREALLTGPAPGNEEAFFEFLDENGLILDKFIMGGLGILEGQAATEERAKELVDKQLRTGGAKLSSEASLKLAGLDTSEIQAQKFAQFQVDHPDVGGPAAGRLTPDALSPLQTEKQAIINTIVAPFLKMLSGAAVTPEEFERISGLLPNVNVSDDINRVRIKAFLDFVRTSRASIERRFGLITASGVDVSKLSPVERTAFAAKIKAQADAEGFGLDVAFPDVPGFTPEEGTFAVDIQGDEGTPGRVDRQAGESFLSSRAREQERQGSGVLRAFTKAVSGGQLGLRQPSVAPPPDIALPLHLRPKKENR